MRKQEFNSKHLPSPARRGSRSRTASPPAPLAIRKAPSGRRRKSRRQSHKFFKHLLRLAPQLAATPWGGSPPRPLCQKICYSDCTKNCPLCPLRAPRRFGIRKSASNSGHSPLRGLGVGLGDDRGTDRPMAALHFLLPTGDSRSGRRSFDSKHLPSPARRGSRSRPPLRRPRPFAIRKAPSASVESIEPRRPRLYGFHTGTRSLSNRKGRGRRSGT